MYCKKCGKLLSEGAKFCNSCGNPITIEKTITNSKGSVGRVGFSSRINDPAFVKYIKARNKWSAIFSIGLAIVAIIGFFIYGETSSEMDNPQALFIGLGIGSMFVVIALVQILGRKRSKTWDGIVVDKKVESKRRKQSVGDNEYRWVDYLEYVVDIKSEDGKIHNIKVQDDDTVYNYYQIGDRVRHHGELNSYEKYDKSRDEIIFCNACASLNNIEDDYCFRCKCPLLK